MNNLYFNLAELSIIKRLNTPSKIQDFLETIPFNFEKSGETCISPRRVLREKRAHCLEGAIFAAAVLWHHGHLPLLLDLKTAWPDFHHVVAPFKIGRYWGAISKTNHAVLRYRDPVYTSVRELVLSYFHEYFLDNGKKTLRNYSLPQSLKRFRARKWTIDEKDLWYIDRMLERAPHKAVVHSGALRNLRRADEIELTAGRITVWKNKK